MSRMTPRSQDTQAGLGSDDPSESLSVALQAVARDAGYEIDRDDLNAVLGLSWTVTAMPSEADLSLWPMYARDAFLLEAGRVFGLTIRAVHPPEAARGLRGVTEFDQHFDASYRPLILRALEHDQAVLAWQGWPGHGALHWGIITNPCDGGSGFAGRVPWPSEARPCDAINEKRMPEPQASACAHPPADRVVLVRPPVQLYVVETITPTRPDPNLLLDLALRHAQCILDNAMENRFGVLTGPRAYDAWIARLDEAAACKTSLTGLVDRHQRLGTAAMAAHRGAIRFLLRQNANQSRGRQPADHRIIQTLTKRCQEVVEAIAESVNPATTRLLGKSTVARTALLDSLGRAREATKGMLQALQT